MFNEHTPGLHEPINERRRWIYILSILDACRWAGLTPITTQALHVITYLSEALAPVWQLEPLDGKVLRQKSAPYFPTLQQDVDRLIGMGLLHVDELQICKTADNSPYLQPGVSLNFDQAAPILSALSELPGELPRLEFLREVAQAFSRIPDEAIQMSMNEDATYGNPATDTGQVIDLGEWRDARTTATSQVAKHIHQLSSGDMSPAEVIDVYVSHIAYRVRHDQQ